MYAARHIRPVRGVPAGDAPAVRPLWRSLRGQGALEWQGLCNQGRGEGSVIMASTCRAVRTTARVVPVATTMLQYRCDLCLLCCCYPRQPRLQLPLLLLLLLLLLPLLLHESAIATITTITWLLLLLMLHEVTAAETSMWSRKRVKESGHVRVSLTSLKSSPANGTVSNQEKMKTLPP